MLQALSTSYDRRVTLAFLGCAAALALGAGLLGTNDHPPGLTLLFLAGVAAVVGFVHPWRRTALFVRLAALAIPAFVVLVVVHNLLDALAEIIGGGVLQMIVQGLSVGAFFGAILISPAALLVGVVGAVIMLIRGQREGRKLLDPATALTAPVSDSSPHADKE